MEFKIGDVLIKNQFILAPMAGVCNEAFRLICKQMGAGLVVAEMVSDKAQGKPVFWRLCLVNFSCTFTIPLANQKITKKPAENIDSERVYKQQHHIK